MWFPSLYAALEFYEVLFKGQEKQPERCTREYLPTRYICAVRHNVGHDFKIPAAIVSSRLLTKAALIHTGAHLNRNKFTLAALHRKDRDEDCYDVYAKY